MVRLKRPKQFIKIEGSSNIAAVHYSDFFEEFTVEFCNGTQYLYKKVPKQTFDAMVEAESKGKFFAANIKGIFEATKIKSIVKEKKDAE